MIERNYKDVLYMARHLTKSKERADDLISETLVWMHSRNPTVPQIDKEFRIWYYKCMYYVSLSPSLGYRKIYNPREILTEAEPKPEQDDERNELIGKLYDEVNDVINSFTGVDKILYELIYTHNLTYREIVYLYKEKTGHTIREISVHRMAKPMKAKLKAKWNI